MYVLKDDYKCSVQILVFVYLDASLGTFFGCFELMSVLLSKRVMDRNCKNGNCV